MSTVLEEAVRPSAQRLSLLNATDGGREVVGEGISDRIKRRRRDEGLTDVMGEDECGAAGLGSGVGSEGERRSVCLSTPFPFTVWAWGRSSPSSGMGGQCT